MRLGLLLGLLVALGAGAAQAQPAGRGELRLLFRLGRVVLTSGDTLDGPVALQFNPDLLLLAQPDGGVRTLAPASVAACAVQQPLGLAAAGADPSQVRLFRALAGAPTARQPRPEVLFYEQLSAGPVLLLRRPRLAQRMVAVATPPPTVGTGVFGIPVGGNSRGLPPPAPPRYLHLPDVRDEFFLARSPQDFVPLPATLKAVQAAFPAQAPALQAYARAQQLRLGAAPDLARLVDFANQLAATAAR